MESTHAFLESFNKARSYGIGEFFEIMGELSQESTKKGQLSRKLKELITFAIALAKQCERCICIHAEEAKRLGASEKELEQVRIISLFMRTSPGTMNIYGNPGNIPGASLYSPKAPSPTATVS